MRRWMSGLPLACLAIVLTTQAQAHFIWIGEARNGDQNDLHLYFGEAAEADSASLLGKIAHSKAWVRTAAPEPVPIELNKRVCGDNGSLMGALPACVTAHSAEAFCDYGVVSRDDTFLLQYYAKHLHVDSLAQLEKLGRAAKLELDIVPLAAADGLDVQVYFGTKPAAGAELVLIGGDEDRLELTADHDGKAHLPTKFGKPCAVRAAWFEKDKSGERDGRKYEQVRHYSTLTLAALPAPTEIPAADLLARARAARAVWSDFHGFGADIQVSVNDQVVSGHMEVDENGVATVDLPDSPAKEWADTQLTSLVQHRMPTNDLDEHVAYADEQHDHPLGRKINLGEKKFNSVYRIKDDVVTEVNRDAGKVRFTISVLEVFRNAEQKYLPRTFTISTWDAASGELRSSLSGVNEWTRIGTYDLPLKILEVTTGKGARDVKQILFSNLKLLPAPSAQTAK